VCEGLCVVPSGVCVSLWTVVSVLVATVRFSLLCCLLCLLCLSSVSSVSGV
jgi:hypothetical protein